MSAQWRPKSTAVRWVWAAVDGAVWVAATFLGSWLRYDFALSSVLTWSAVAFAAGAALLHVLLGALMGPYGVAHLRGSYEEVSDLARVTVLTMGTLVLANILLPTQAVPRSVPVIAGLVALTAMFAIRMVVRSAGVNSPGEGAGARPTIVLGAGEGGRQLVRSLTRDPEGSLYPVALLDDDKAKRRLRIDGVRVRGDRHSLAEVARQTGAQVLAIAIPGADAHLIRELDVAARTLGLDVLTLPTAAQLLDPSRRVQDLRRINVEDLLGRRPVQLDSAAIAQTITGRTILVTGAGGSIGSELCRQIQAFHPARLVLVDRDESALHSAEMGLTGRALLDGENTVLADIRDLDRMREVMAQVRPDVVFHAAALKHLPLLEKYPEEAWKTNVLGTLNVLTASREAGVSTFVNISTDKAASPGCVLGYSKRVAERLTAAFGQSSTGLYVSVRFGNVLGSRGSVVGAFTAQIERGGPVTVTHPDVERYFMLIPEACQLVLEAAAIGSTGAVMVLDMGQPAKIVEVAQTLINLSGRTDVEIVFTGLRPGEKMSEDLFAHGEHVHQSAHPLVSQVTVPALEPRDVEAAHVSDPAAALAWMRERALLAEAPS